MMQIRFPRCLAGRHNVARAGMRGSDRNPALGFLAALLCRVGRIHPSGLAALLLATATGALAGPATPGIAVGDRHALVLQANGSVWAWGGRNTSGLPGSSQRGDGTTALLLTPVLVSGVAGVTAVARSGAHSLVLKTDGTVWGWGGQP